MVYVVRVKDASTLARVRRRPALAHWQPSSQFEERHRMGRGRLAHHASGRARLVYDHGHTLDRQSRRFEVAADSVEPVGRLPIRHRPSALMGVGGRIPPFQRLAAD